jgi:antitoxin FitA
MSVTITVRDVPDDVRDELAARAARSGRSLQEYLRAQLIDLSAYPTAADAVAAIRSRARAYPPFDLARVLDDLDADRR